MIYGANWPYDMWDMSEIEHAIGQLRDMGATEVTIMSHQVHPDLLWLLKNIGITTFHIRAKTGPGNLGTYPGFILDYAEWPSERTLRMAITDCMGLDIIPHVILGNEPDIEMAEHPDNSDWFLFEAEEYKRWYETEVVNIRAAFSGMTVWVSPAPLSQGWFDRFTSWFNVLWPTYNSDFCDFIAEHCYLGIPPIEWQGRFSLFSPIVKSVHITEFNDNGTGRTSTTYAQWVREYEKAGVEAVSLFTLAGGPNSSGNQPEWWFLTDEEIAEIRKEFTANDAGNGEEVSVMNIYDGFLQLWHAENGSVNAFVGEDFSGIFKAWSRDPSKYGSPVANEFTTDDGRTVQAFATGLYEWKDGGLVRVESGL